MTKEQLEKGVAINDSLQSYILDRDKRISDYEMIQDAVEDDTIIVNVLADVKVIIPKDYILGIIDSEIQEANGNIERLEKELEAL